MRKIYVSTAVVLLSFAAAAQTGTDSLPSKNALQEVVVSGIKAKEKMPITHTTLSQKQIEERYYGADIPTLLNFTPSINTYSDNGTGIGYTNFRLRGLDATRVNFTINGVPVNDPESQGVFFNNFADLASSAGNIQVQRGVGTSTNGTASFAGSVNLTTKTLSETPQFTLNTGFGSFHSRRLTAEYQTGLLQNKFAFYGRVSDLATDGYRDHSGSHIRSLFLSSGYFGKRSVLKFNILSGYSASQLAYSGITKSMLDTNRRYNPFTRKEEDAFTQHFYQLQYTYRLNKYSGVSFSGYYVYGNAPKFQYYWPQVSFAFLNMPNFYGPNDTFTTTDAMLSYRLNQHFYGGYANYYYKKNTLDVNIGLHTNSFSSEHFMEVNRATLIPPDINEDHKAYSNTGYKSEMSAFTKATYNFNEKLSVFADLQLRYATYKYIGREFEIRKDTLDVEDMIWGFFNPKFGLRYEVSNILGLYAMVGRTSREPTRIDYFGDDFATRDGIKQSDIKVETVMDYELGTSISTTKLAVRANLFYMDFENQIVNTGQINVVGYPITTNIKNSLRAGFEMDLTWKPLRYLWLMNSSAFSRSEIKDYTQYYDSAGAYTTSVPVNVSNTVAALSPQIIVNQGIRVIPASWFYADMTIHYVSHQYLDNTKDNELSIPAFYFADTRFVLSLKKWIKAGEPTIAFQVNNITDRKYAPSGNTTGNVMNYDASGNATKGSTALFLPAAERNYFVTLTCKF